MKTVLTLTALIASLAAQSGTAMAADHREAPTLSIGPTAAPSQPAAPKGDSFQIQTEMISMDLRG